MKKILLKENEVAYNQLLSYEISKYDNGKTLLAMLAKIGLNLSSVENWESIEQEFKKDYPKANLTFNLQANGIEQEYKEAEAYYLKHRQAMTFEPLTEDQQEAIREQYRLYATTPQQIEAHGLINSIVDNFNRLYELGVNSMDGAQIRNIDRVFAFSHIDKVKFQIQPDALTKIIQAIK